MLAHVLPFLGLISAAFALGSDAPVVSSLSGKYVGSYLPTFDQDAFLGIPYASQPTRFAPSTLIQPSTGSEISAKGYGLQCPAYGSDTVTLLQRGYMKMGEDCLNLNVVRPHGESEPGHLLPVLVWIYGGGWQQGATSDPRYNLSYVVQQSVEAGKPVIAVSINYRTAGFGFLYGQTVMNSMNTNLGIRDQRVALQFVQKNIGSFGGDPKKVTIWGESAGAYSVGTHLLAYGGRDDGLFRAAILESGNAVGPPYNDTRWYQPLYDKLTTTTGCYNATDTLKCLSELPFDTIYPALNITYEWFAVVDGTFVREWPVSAISKGNLVKVPLLLGSNTDEGVSFGTTGVNTDDQAVAQLITSKRWVVTPYQAEKILSLYPNDPTVGSPYGTGNTTWPNLGLQYKRYSSIAGDLTMAAPRRMAAEAWSKYAQVFSYRFDSPLYNTSTRVGVQHFSEIPYVFSNPDQTITPLGNSTNDLQLGHLMARMWASFATDLDPNNHGGTSSSS